MRATPLTIIVSFVALLILAPRVTHAAPCALYGSDAADSARNLWLLDPATGAGRVIGDMGGEITGIAVHPFTGVLYGVTASIQLFPQNFSPGDLVVIDRGTGAATLVGSLGLANLSNEGPTLADIAFDPATGILYGWRARSGGDLYTVNLQTGAATLVGESGLTLSGGQGLIFGPQGRLFLAGEGTQGLLRTIDKSTGLPIASVQLTGYPSNVNIVALAFDGTKIFGVADSGGDLITIDPDTGVITTIGPVASGLGVPSNSIDGIAFDCVVHRGVPAFSNVSVACLAAALLVFGLCAARSKHPTLGRTKR